MKSSAPIAPDELLVAAAQRDASHFAALYETHFERVYAFIVRRVRDRDIAEDLTADVFQHALANLSRFEWRGVPFAGWLFRIASNAIIDRAKRSAKERAIPRPDDPIARSPEDTEDCARLFRLVDRLPTDQRRVILMRFAEEKKIRDIAAALGRSAGAVKQLQLRGLQNLRRLLGESNG